MFVASIPLWDCRHLHVEVHWSLTPLLLYITAFVGCIQVLSEDSLIFLDAVVAPSDASAAHEVSFSGNGYLRLPRSFTDWLRKGGASFELKTYDNDAILMYHGGREDSELDNSEFIAVAISGGNIELR